MLSQCLISKLQFSPLFSEFLSIMLSSATQCGKLWSNRTVFILYPVIILLKHFLLAQYGRERLFNFFWCSSLASPNLNMETKGISRLSLNSTLQIYTFLKEHWVDNIQGKCRFWHSSTTVWYNVIFHCFVLGKHNSICPICFTEILPSHEVESQLC